MTVLTTHPQAHKRMHHMLFVIMLLFLYCCFFAVYSNANPAITEHRCIYDSIAKQPGPPSTATIMELPRRKRSGVQFLMASESAWKPIRFSVFTEDMNNESRYCSAVGQEVSDFQGGTVTCREEHILTDAKKNIIVNEILPQAIKLHAERLLVEPMTNPIIVPKYMPFLCSKFTVPRSHHTEGVKNADFVLYTAAGPANGETFAWSTLCVQLLDERPVVGVINLNPSKASSREFFVRMAARGIGHALGFSINNFRRAGMLSTRTGVRGKPIVTLVATPRVVEKTRAHYNCPTAPGMELEDAGGMGIVGSHWKARNAKDELMSSVAGVGYYTALTMALFEDLGYFRANWTMAETMNWGRNAGCDFLEKKCVIEGATAYPEMFCTKKEDIKLCTSDRLALGYCSIKPHKTPLPPQFRYFDDIRVGGLYGTLTDHCPILLQHSYTECVDGLKARMPGSRVGPSSRCLKGNGLYYDGKPIGDVCAEVRCHKNGDVSLRYDGNDAWHLCPEGGSVEPTGSLTGKIVCPKYSEVCYETGKDQSDVDLSLRRATS